VLIVLDWSVLGAPESWKWLPVSDNDPVVGLSEELLDIDKALGG